MPLSINTNLASMTAQRSFLNSNSALETAFERLSTGKRVTVQQMMLQALPLVRIECELLD